MIVAALPLLVIRAAVAILGAVLAAPVLLARAAWLMARAGCSSEDRARAPWFGKPPVMGARG